jgi:hypothetical protein
MTALIEQALRFASLETNVFTSPNYGEWIFIPVGPARRAAESTSRPIFFRVDLTRSAPVHERNLLTRPAQSASNDLRLCTRFLACSSGPRMLDTSDGAARDKAISTEARKNVPSLLHFICRNDHPEA